MDPKQKCRIARKLFEQRMRDEHEEERDIDLHYAPSECYDFVWRHSQRIVRAVFEKLDLDPHLFDAVLIEWGDRELANYPFSDDPNYIPDAYVTRVWATDYQYSPPVTVR